MERYGPRRYVAGDGEAVAPGLGKMERYGNFSEMPVSVAMLADELNGDCYV